MIHYLHVLGARLGSTTWVTWFPRATMPVAQGFTPNTKLDPLPSNYWCQALFRFEPIRGMQLLWAEDRSGDLTAAMMERVDPLTDPLLAKVLASMVPKTWQDVWAVPDKPKDYLAPRS